MLIPAAVIYDPGASMVRNEALLENHVTVSAEPTGVPGPPSYTAPTETAAGTQPGDDIRFVYPSLPDAATERIPADRAFATGKAKTSVSHGFVEPPPPRLILMTEIL
jgi:hypothetical protein